MLLYFQTLVQCLTHGKYSINTPLLLPQPPLCSLFQAKPPWSLSCFSADMDSGMCPHSVYFCSSLQTRYPALEKACGLSDGPPNYGPEAGDHCQHYMCGCRCDLAERWWHLARTIAWVMRHQPQVLSTSQRGLIGKCQADLPAPTKPGGKGKLPSALLGITQTNE